MNIDEGGNLQKVQGVHHRKVPENAQKVRVVVIPVGVEAIKTIVIVTMIRLDEEPKMNLGVVIVIVMVTAASQNENLDLNLEGAVVTVIVMTIHLNVDLDQRPDVKTTIVIVMNNYLKENLDQKKNLLKEGKKLKKNFQKK